MFGFSVSLHYELFFALQALTDSRSRVHPAWREGAAASLPSAFGRRFESLGPSHYLWPCVADALEGEDECRDFPGVISGIESVQATALQKRILLGVLHTGELVEGMLAGRFSLSEAIVRAPRAKREWLGFVGLYPYVKDQPLARALECLIRTPEEFRRAVLLLVKSFWNSSFRSTWSELQPRLQRSMEEKERLFHSCTPAEFARLALLRVELDEKAGTLKAIRGGFRLALKDVSAVHLFPSCFNDQRHWTCYGRAGETVVCFPYFDPSISIGTPGRKDRLDLAEPDLDPALIFSALGDSTRFAMVSMLARSAATSADLSRTLALSRPTVSHHIHVLREAGLLHEAPEGNSVCLSVRREVLEKLSQLTVDRLFNSTEEIPIKKTRTK